MQLAIRCVPVTGNKMNEASYWVRKTDLCRYVQMAGVWRASFGECAARRALYRLRQAGKYFRNGLFVGRHRILRERQILQLDFIHNRLLFSGHPPRCSNAAFAPDIAKYTIMQHQTELVFTHFFAAHIKTEFRVAPLELPSGVGRRDEQKDTKKTRHREGRGETRGRAEERRESKHRRFACFVNAVGFAKRGRDKK